jgi:phospholipid/cholesterol/gamma-HCH transport system substrate-binding protein
MTPQYSPQTGKIVPRRFQGRVDPFRAGLVATILVLVATFLAFSKELPWRDPFQFKAVFESANNIRLDSPVRVAGVEVGRVTGVDHFEDSNLGIVTMEVDESGLPIHDDAQLKIRPRLFLEGNFFIEMTAGTPSRPAIEDGHTIPVTQTAYPVQIDNLLTSLQQDSRKNLQSLLEGLGTALVHQPTQVEDIGQDPDVQGKRAGEALNKSLEYAGPAFKSASEVQHAFLGTQPRDLRKLIAGLQKTFRGLGQNEEQLKDFFTNFNRTMQAIASEQSNLRRAIATLGPTIERAETYFTNFARALPPTRDFVRAFIPAVRETPATIAAATPWTRQFTALVSRSELGGLLRDLRPMTAAFARVVSTSIGFNRQADFLSRCFADVILPSGDVVLQDGAGTTGAENFKEFWYSLVGFAGESQNFDGNGQYTRVQSGGGAHLVKSGRIPGRQALDAELFGNAVLPPIGTRPRKPPSKPAYRPNDPCYKQAPPSLNGPAAQPGPPDAPTAGR